MFGPKLQSFCVINSQRPRMRRTHLTIRAVMMGPYEAIQSPVSHDPVIGVTLIYQGDDGHVIIPPELDAELGSGRETEGNRWGGDDQTKGGHADELMLATRVRWFSTRFHPALNFGIFQPTADTPFSGPCLTSNSLRDNSMCVQDLNPRGVLRSVMTLSILAEVVAHHEPSWRPRNGILWLSTPGLLRGFR